MILEHLYRLGRNRSPFKNFKKVLRSILRRKTNDGKTPRILATNLDSDSETIGTLSTISGHSARSSTIREGYMVTVCKETTIDDPTETDSVAVGDGDEIEVYKAHALVYDDDDATACTAISHSSSLSSRSKREDSVPISLMEERLLNTDLVKRDDFDFVPDYVSKEVLHLIDEETRLRVANNKENVSHVKTGIWEVTIFEDDGSPKDTYYIVIGVSMDGRVDTKKLRKQLFAGQQEQYKRRPKMEMAPTDIAEGLAGYRSGTIAPLCHTKNMKLFLEESLVTGVDDTETHRLYVGSGMFGKCLSISVKNFLSIAEANPNGLKICPIIRTGKK